MAADIQIDAGALEAGRAAFTAEVESFSLRPPRWGARLRHTWFRHGRQAAALLDTLSTEERVALFLAMRAVAGEGTPQLRLESRIDCESAIVRSWDALTIPLLMHLEYQLYEVGAIIEEYLFESKTPFSNDGDALHIWRTQALLRALVNIGQSDRHAIPHDFAHAVRNSATFIHELAVKWLDHLCKTDLYGTMTRTPSRATGAENESIPSLDPELAERSMRELCHELSFGEMIRQDHRRHAGRTTTEAIVDFCRGEVVGPPTQAQMAELCHAILSSSACKNIQRALQEASRGLFQIFTREMLQGLAEYVYTLSHEFAAIHRRLPRIVELGAGDGRFAAQLQRFLSPLLSSIPVSILAVDNQSWNIAHRYPVTQTDGVGAAAQADIILGSWWPYRGTAFDLEVARMLPANPAKTLILVHAGSGGCVGTRYFWKYADTALTEVASNHSGFFNVNQLTDLSERSYSNVWSTISVFRARSAPPPPPLPPSLESNR